MSTTETEELEKLKAEVERLTNILNTPLYDEFIDAVKKEASHQVWRWGREHDANKEPQDWFWTLGYLSGKALSAHMNGDRTKALHHTISSAALLLHWHQIIKEDESLQDTPQYAEDSTSRFRHHIKLPLIMGAGAAVSTGAVTLLFIGTTLNVILWAIAGASIAFALPFAATGAALLVDHFRERRRVSRAQKETRPDE